MQLTRWPHHGGTQHRPVERGGRAPVAPCAVVPAHGRRAIACAAALDSGGDGDGDGGSAAIIAPPPQRRRLSLFHHLQPYTYVNWHRFELLLYERAERQAEEEDEAEEGEVEEGEDSGETAGAFAPAGVELTSAYFRRWDDPSRHLPLLQDRALLAAWTQALAAAPPGALEGKTVLDVGCGTGLLSVLAAKAGAARVIAVDGSAGAADAARRVVKANGLQDRITVVHGAMEEVELPGVAPGEVDVIVSNWMGPGLLGGGMLPALASAVERWLRPGGVVLPDSASLWTVGLEDREALQEAKKTWSAVAGVDMSAALAQVIQHPRIDSPRRFDQLLTAPQRLAHWRPAQLGGVAGGEEGSGQAAAPVLDPVTGTYARCPIRLSVERAERLFGLLLYWEAEWSWGGALGQGGAKPAIRLSTGPQAAPTHYKQVVLDFPRSMRVAPGDALAGELELRPGGSDPRDVQLSLGLALESADKEGAEEAGAAAESVAASFTIPWHALA